MTRSRMTLTGLIALAASAGCESTTEITEQECFTLGHGQGFEDGYIAGFELGEEGIELEEPDDDDDDDDDDDESDATELEDVDLLDSAAPAEVTR